MTFLHKIIISNKYLRYSSFWWWWRLIAHQDFRFDDYYVYKEFWYSINSGFINMNQDWEFEKFWGKNAKPETALLSKENYDRLVERLNEPPDPKSVERLKEIMTKSSPWENVK